MKRSPNLAKKRKDRQNFAKEKRIAKVEHAKAKRSQIVGEKGEGWDFRAAHPHHPNIGEYAPQACTRHGYSCLLCNSNEVKECYKTREIEIVFSN